MAKNRKSASYHDIADLAGVSIATVSRVIHGGNNVSPELTMRVKQAMERLNYTPNIIARSLRKKATKSIGIVTTELTNPFYSDITVAAENFLMDHGYMALVCNTFNDPEKEEAYIRALLERRVDGLIFTSARFEGGAWQRLKNTAVPFVLVNRRSADIDTDYVGVDNVGGMRTVIEHLIDLGHRRIGYIGGFLYSSSARDRRRGYRATLSAHDIPPDDDLCFDGNYDIESGIEGARHLLSLPKKKRPTAIAAANDYMAFGAMDYATKAGFRLPQDLSVTGFDDLRLSGLAPFSLTSVRQPREEMGRAAAKTLLQRIEDETDDKTQIIEYPCDLIVRETTQPPRGVRGG